MRLELHPRAVKELRRVPGDDSDRIRQALQRIAEDPFTSKATKVKGSEAVFRLRVGDFRILYAVENDCILVARIDKRARVYKR